MNSVLTQLKELGIISVTLTGGEPLLRTDLVEIVRKCAALGYDDVTLLTNGVLLTANRAEELLEAGVTTVNISLDGIEKIHDEIRGLKGVFGKITSALKLLADLKQKKYRYLKVNINLTLMKPNLPDVIAVANLVRELGVGFGFVEGFLFTDALFAAFEIANVAVD